MQPQVLALEPGNREKAIGMKRIIHDDDKLSGMVISEGFSEVN